jgi:hypothetical protein
MLQYQDFAIRYNQILQEYPLQKHTQPSDSTPTSPPIMKRTSTGTPSVPMPNITIAEDVICPSLDPPTGFTHCTGFFQQNGTSFVWCERIPSLRLEQLPANITYIESHWKDRVLYDGSMVVGKETTGEWIVALPGYPNFPGNTTVAGRYTPVITQNHPQVMQTLRYAHTHVGPPLWYTLTQP